MHTTCAENVVLLLGYDLVRKVQERFVDASGDERWAHDLAYTVASWYLVPVCKHASLVCTLPALSYGIFGIFLPEPSRKASVKLVPGQRQKKSTQGPDFLSI